MQPLTPVVKNIIIINAILFVFGMLAQGMNPDLAGKFQMYLSGHYPLSEFFFPTQIVTHMFMHGSISHIFFNMFGVFIFGATLEKLWGPKRFLIYYFFTGLGAFFLHMFIFGFEVYQGFGSFFPEMSALPVKVQQYINYSGVVGASGALFGLLLAFGMLFPNTKLYLIFFPVGIKAKYFVIGYGLIELYSGLSNNAGDNVAHFAHLGGMLFGFILLKRWQQNKNQFY